MRLTVTKQTEYALRALIWLGEHGSVGSVSGNGSEARHKAAEIVGATGMPPLFAARVLAQLQRRGLVRARAGAHGGYTLARPPSEITLLEVIEATEGPLQANECVLRDAPCGGEAPCVLHFAWSAAQAALRAVLERTTLAEPLPVMGKRTDSSPLALDAVDMSLVVQPQSQ